MIFQNLWAWIGLVAIAAPIAAHLYARRPARRQPFPHLRFLPAAALKPIQRDRVADLLLLLLRCAILAAAVAALTRPLWLTHDRARDLGNQIARAIIVDTSASMERTTTAGGLAVDAAEREAARLAAQATTSRIGKSPHPAQLVGGAVAWLATQPRRRELVVISDFQVGALSRADLAGVPTEAGIATVAIEIAKVDARRSDSEKIGASGAQTGVKPESDQGQTGVKPGSNNSLSPSPITTPTPPTEIALLTKPEDQDAARAARAAAIDRGAPASLDVNRPIAIIYPGFEDQAGIQQSSTPIDQPWMFDVLSSVINDADVKAAFARAGRRSSDAIAALRATIKGQSLEVLMPRAAPGSLESAAVISAALRASANSIPASELSVATIPEDERRSWERPAASVAPSGSQITGDESDGRWLWAVALVLIGIEMLVRRRQPKPAAVEVPRARVA